MSHPRVPRHTRTLHACVTGVVLRGHAVVQNDSPAAANALADPEEPGLDKWIEVSGTEQEASSSVLLSTTKSFLSGGFRCKI